MRTDTTPQHKPPTDSTYRADYERGWRYSKSPTATLNNTGDKSDAWMDGYMDWAAGREKWHHFYCRQSGGCVEHTYS